jgi:hypothetical protein
MFKDFKKYPSRAAALCCSSIVGFVGIGKSIACLSAWLYIRFKKITLNSNLLSIFFLFLSNLVFPGKRMSYLIYYFWTGEEFDKMREGGQLNTRDPFYSAPFVAAEKAYSK